MRLNRLVSAAAVLTATLGILVPTLRAAPPNPRRTPVVDVVERARAAVVNIHSERTALGPAAEELFTHTPSQNRINGMGTGIIVDSRGYLVTNQHVVEEVNVIRVRLSDGSTHSARVLARDHESDLALLKIDVARPLPTLPLGTSSDLMVGETVIAIGNAYGYEHSVTVGVISAIQRDVTLNREISYKGLIQTDASINPGNSGGPLLNINGELIGVNVAIRAGAQGIGFAIPVDSMLGVVADLLSVRKRNGLWHGLVCRDCVGELESERVKTPEDEGTKTKTVSTSALPLSNSATLARWLVVDRTEPASPAARAGLQPGDVVVQAADTRVGCALDFERALLDRSAGESVPLVVRRQGAEQHLDLVLQPVERAAAPAAELVWRKLGLRLSPVGVEAVAQNNRQLRGGMMVIDIDPAAAAGKAGIQRGDILVGLHQWETVSLDNVAYVLTHPDLASFNPLRFFIVRSGQVHRGWLQQVD
jgi:serine protease Do